MVERDFWADQLYFLRKQRIHNSYLHGWGVVCGLKVNPHPICPNLKVVVEPGLAIDCWGREIFIPKPYEVLLESYKKNGTDNNQPKPKNLYIYLSYKECKTEPVPLFIDECGCNEQFGLNRIHEEFKIELNSPLDVEPDEFSYSKIVSSQEVSSKVKNIDLNSDWSQFDSGTVDGTITIKDSGNSYTSSKTIDQYANVQELMDEINTLSWVSINYDDDNKFTLELATRDVLVLEQTGINPFFYEIKMPAYHTEYQKLLVPCSNCFDNSKIIIATIEGYDQIGDAQLDSSNPAFKSAAYKINNFEFRKTVPNIGFIDEVIHYLAKKGF